MSDNNTHTNHPRIPDWALLVTVFITGACVLIVELMGTRILAPYFGSGIYTWSSLIAITLAALALGYTFGGRLADRLPRTDILYSLCLVAGLWTLLTPLLASPLLPVMILIPDIRVGVILSSIVLYFPNLFLLGAVCPFVIRLLTSKRETVGSVSGRVFAVSTIGSLLGALGTGFVLIPGYGVQDIFTFCGVVLFALAILGNFRAKFIGYALVLAALVLSLMLYTSKKPAAESSIEILEQTSSFYGQLHVIRKGRGKSLLVDGIGQNYVFDNDIYSTPYLNFIAALPELRHKPVKPGQKSVVIGLGAGQLPMIMQRIGLDVEAVDIDPKVGELAEKHFNFHLPGESIHYVDGRLFLLRTSNRYEYLVIDAFSAEQIASHLLSKEAFIEAQNRMTESGVLAINVTSLKTGKDIAALQRTLKAVFPHVRAFSFDEDDILTSIVFLASSIPIHLSSENTSLNNLQLTNAEDFLSKELTDLHSGILLTDDFNPISHYRKHVQLLWREAMIEYLGEENLRQLLL